MTFVDVGNKLNTIISIPVAHMHGFVSLATGSANAAKVLATLEATGRNNLITSITINFGSALFTDTSFVHATVNSATDILVANLVGACFKAAGSAIVGTAASIVAAKAILVVGGIALTTAAA